jgi:outer membrane protein assembly factor BamB
MIDARLKLLAYALVLQTSFAGCHGPTPVPPPYLGPQWTQFRMNPQHNPRLPGKLRVRWRDETHGGFSSSPAIVGITLYIGNNAGSLYAVDVRNGRIRWRFHVSGPLMSNPLVWHNLVIVGEGNGDFFFPPPAHQFTVGTAENALIAVDLRTGKPRWRIALPGSGMPTPAIVRGTLLQHNGGRQLLIVDPDTGAIRSRVDVISAAAMSAILPMGDTFATVGGSAAAVQKRYAADGSLVWAAVFPTAWGMSDCPLASDGHSVFCNYLDPPPGLNEDWRNFEPAVQHAYSVDFDTGRIRWDVTLERGVVPHWNEAAIPLVVGNTVFFGSPLAAYVHAQDSADGSVRWRVHVHGPVKGGIVEKNGILYFGDLAGYLWAVDLRNGGVLGDKNMHTKFNVGSPIIDGETLLIGSNTGSIIAIPLEAIASAHDA